MKFRDTDDFIEFANIFCEEFITKVQTANKIYPNLKISNKTTENRLTTSLTTNEITKKTSDDFFMDIKSNQDMLIDLLVSKFLNNLNSLHTIVTELPKGVWFEELLKKPSIQMFEADCWAYQKTMTFKNGVVINFLYSVEKNELDHISVMVFGKTIDE